MQDTMLKSHVIMGSIYNLSIHRKDYNFELFEKNRVLLSSLLQNAENAEMNLVIFHDSDEFVFYLLDDNSNYVDTRKNVLYFDKLTKNMIKSKNVMDHLFNLLNQLDLKIQTNKIMQREAQSLCCYEDDPYDDSDYDSIEHEQEMGELALAEEMRQEGFYEEVIESALW